MGDSSAALGQDDVLDHHKELLSLTWDDPIPPASSPSEAAAGAGPYFQVDDAAGAAGAAGTTTKPAEEEEEEVLPESAKEAAEAAAMSPDKRLLEVARILKATDPFETLGITEPPSLEAA